MTRRWNVAALRDRYYSGYNRFSAISRVVERAAPDAHVLEIGCGDGRNSPDLRGRVALYAGIDTDPRVLGNSKLDHARIGSAERLPWPDQTFDIVFHHMVAEHLADPTAVMCETARVLKPGGTLVFETPNCWHYAMIAAALTPHWFHEWYLPLAAAEARCSRCCTGATAEARSPKRSVPPVFTARSASFGCRQTISGCTRPCSCSVCSTSGRSNAWSQHFATESSLRRGVPSAAPASAARQ